MESAANLNLVAAQRILVVDDNEDSAICLAMLMQKAGHQTKTAFNGESALEIARSFKPSFVLLDISLPGMDGYAVAESLRKMPEACDAVLAAVTGYGDDERRKRSEEAGFDHHLVKPIKSATVLEIIQAMGD